MHPSMRRKDRAISEEESLELVQKAAYGILATSNEDLPYAPPVSFIYHNGAIYFHCAQVGRKLDNIKANPAVCFTVVGDAQAVYTSDFTTYFESVMLFGNAVYVLDEEERRQALLLLCEKYLPQHMDKAEQSISHSAAHTAIIKIPVDHISGKANKPHAAG